MIIQFQNGSFINDSSYNRDFNKQTDAAAVNKQISVQEDSRPSELSRPLTSITLKLNGDLNVTPSFWPPSQFA